MQDRRRRPPPKTDRRWRTRQKEDGRKQRIAWVVGGVALLLILAFPAFGFYRTYVLPPRQLAASVGGVKFTRGDLVKLVRVMASAERGQGGELDLTTAPFEVLYNMVENELIRQAAPEYSIRVTNEDLDAALKARFYPEPAAGETPSEDDLNREYQERYRGFLTQSQLSDKDYRQVVQFQLYRDRLREELAAREAFVRDHVEVEWIKVSQENADPTAITKKIREGAAFADVARESNVDTIYAADQTRPGYVGWIPRQAFRQFDPYFFGPAATPDPSTTPTPTAFGSEGSTTPPPPEDEVEQLKVGEVSDPITVDEGTFIIRVISAPTVREITEAKWKDKLKNESLKRWIEQRWTEKDVQVSFDADVYAWVVKQVRKALPSALETPTAVQQQPGVG